MVNLTLINLLIIYIFALVTAYDLPAGTKSRTGVMYVGNCANSNLVGYTALGACVEPGTNEPSFGCRTVDPQCESRQTVAVAHETVNGGDCTIHVWIYECSAVQLFECGGVFCARAEYCSNTGFHCFCPNNTTVHDPYDTGCHATWGDYLAITNQHNVTNNNNDTNGTNPPLILDNVITPPIVTSIIYPTSDRSPTDWDIGLLVVICVLTAWFICLTIFVVVNHNKHTQIPSKPSWIQNNRVSPSAASTTSNHVLNNPMYYTVSAVPGNGQSQFDDYSHLQDSRHATIPNQVYSHLHTTSSS